MAPEEKNNLAEGAAPAGGITSRRNFLLWLGLGLAAVVVVADQASKWVIVSFLYPQQLIPVLPVFNIVFYKNTGVSFGLFGGAGQYVLSALALAVCGGMIWWLRGAETRLLAIGIGAIVGGAIGNVIDRLRLGAVVDFLDFYIAGYAHFPAFNVADSAITAGVCLVLVDGLFAGKAKTG